MNELFEHPPDFKCKQCGKCCLYYHASMSEVTLYEDDWQCFEDADRYDIMRYLEPIYVGNSHYIYDGWFNPKTRDEWPRCPWFRKLPNQNKYKCRIYELRPDICREYPQLGRKKDVIKIGCKGWE